MAPSDGQFQYWLATSAPHPSLPSAGSGFGQSGECLLPATLLGTAHDPLRTLGKAAKVRALRDEGRS